MWWIVERSLSVAITSQNLLLSSMSLSLACRRLTAAIGRISDWWKREIGMMQTGWKYCLKRSSEQQPDDCWPPVQVHSHFLLITWLQLCRVKQMLFLLASINRLGTTEIKQFCFRFVSDKIILLQFYFSASYVWNKMLTQIKSRWFYVQSSSVNWNFESWSAWRRKM